MCMHAASYAWSRFLDVSIPTYVSNTRTPVGAFDLALSGRRFRWSRGRASKVCNAFNYKVEEKRGETYDAHARTERAKVRASSRWLVSRSQTDATDHCASGGDGAIDTTLGNSDCREGGDVNRGWVASEDDSPGTHPQRSRWVGAAGRVVHVARMATRGGGQGPGAVLRCMRRCAWGAFRG